MTDFSVQMGGNSSYLASGTSTFANATNSGINVSSSQPGLKVGVSSASKFINASSVATPVTSTGIAGGSSNFNSTSYAGISGGSTSNLAAGIPTLSPGFGASLPINQGTVSTHPQLNSGSANLAVNNPGHLGVSVSASPIGASSESLMSGVNSGSNSNPQGKPALSNLPFINNPEYKKSVTANGTIILNLEDLQANTQVLKETVKNVIVMWNDILYKQIEDLENSWVGADASLYTEKVKAFDKKIKAACQAIELLADTFNKSGNEISNVQEQNIRDLGLI